MATVTSFECLSHPSRSELRQFADLFTPLYLASSEDARREAIAALSQSPHVPPAIAYFVACQPISIAAPFLIASKALSDDALINIARTQGAAHARAIVRRDDLSPTVIDALVGLRYVQSQPAAETLPEDAAQAQEQVHIASSTRGEEQAPAQLQAKAELQDDPEGANAPSHIEAPDLDARADEILAREERLRAQLREMVQQHHRSEDDRLGMLSLTELQDALLVRAARDKDGALFAGTLSDILSSSRWLAERILLDISGHQLATALIGLGMTRSQTVQILESFYPHLKRLNGEVSRAAFITDMMDPIESEFRLDNWRRADQMGRLNKDPNAGFTPLNNRRSA